MVLVYVLLAEQSSDFAAVVGVAGIVETVAAEEADLRHSTFDEAVEVEHTPL